MYKKRRKEKIIAIKDSDCSITRRRRPKNLQQLIHQNYTGLPGCTPVFDNGGGGEFGGASASIARLHTWHRGCLSGTCALSEAENFVFLKWKFWYIYGEYKQKFRSGNELKKKVAEEEGENTKKKNT